MIDRSYLPFQAAREYQDPGMQKWMGFFLSEHTSSLHAAKSRVDFSTDLSKPQKLLLLSQLYANQLKGQFTIKHRDRKVTLFGEVREFSFWKIIYTKKATTYIMWLLLFNYIN